MAEMELDGVFIDMYGTLTSGDRAAVEAVCETIVRENNLTLTPHQLSISWGERFFKSIDCCTVDSFLTLLDLEIKTLRETMTELKVDMDPVPHCVKLQEYWRNPPLQPEVVEFLTTFKYPLCIVSNADHEDVLRVVRQHNLQVDHVVTSEETRSYKPDKVIFEKALKRTGWRRDRVLHVGDSLHSDIGGAMAAGIRNVWINRQHRIHDIGTHVPDFEFDSLLRFAESIHQLSGKVGEYASPGSKLPS